MLVLNTSAVLLNCFTILPYPESLPLYFVLDSGLSVVPELLGQLLCSAVEFFSSLCNRHSPSPVLSLWHTVLGDKTRQLLLGMNVGVAVGHVCVCTGICRVPVCKLATLLEV
uniref:Uncharacterized protein n=1 Tax=Macaca nemestrina TaxID=9545 RepID=A0A2K6AUY5_MACNE